MKIKVGMVISTWGKQCGVADYTKQLIEATQNSEVEFKVYTEIDEHFPFVIGRDRIDIVHLQHEYSIYDLKSLYYAMCKLNQLQIPIITTLHSWSSDMIPHNLLISSKSSKIIVHSEAVKQLCVQHGFCQEQVSVNLIGCHSYELQPAEQIKKMFHITGNPCIGFFGFPFPHKGIMNLIEAINMVKVYFPDIKAYFFSHYPDSVDKNHPYYTFQQELQEIFNEHDHLIWAKEYLPEKALVHLLHTMDMSVLPYVDNHYQGISSAVRLLMSAKKPIITTDYLNFSDLNREVYKIPDEHPETIARAICQIYLNSTLQEQLISHVEAFLKQNSWERIGSRYRELYQTFLSDHESEEMNA
ncbi:glycosyltransferase [Brevibacillus borstelensis]|uniref:glycosyltransferase n=1 Tax=Brevibacillus borstelensis TaxID=45462 RepID=UPI0030C04EE8